MQLFCKISVDFLDFSDVDFGHGFCFTAILVVLNHLRELLVISLHLRRNITVKLVFRDCFTAIYCRLTIGDFLFKLDTADIFPKPLRENFPEHAYVLVHIQPRFAFKAVAF